MRCASNMVGDQTRPFIAFVPLSRWLDGFDRYAMAWSKRDLPRSRYPDAMYMLDERGPWNEGSARARAAVRRGGIEGDAVVALRASLPVGPGAMQPNTVTGTGIGWRWPASSVPLVAVGWLDEKDAFVPARHEEITARAFALGGAVATPWAEARPRSFSVLPVARACQARCAFCFSKGSVSELASQRMLSLEHLERWAERARLRGAERAVITGGGEPTLLPRARLLAIVRIVATRFASSCLITHGATLDAPTLSELREAGLTTLAVSRHGLDAEHDARISRLPVRAVSLGHAAREAGLRARSVCVLCRDGVDDAAAVLRYVVRCADEGFAEVCFKELYLSSTLESPWAGSETNHYAATHQVPLAVVLQGLERAGFVRASTLPWGSPVYEGEVRGVRMRVAAYTEPSVGWERRHGVVRSWNLMADGRCYASLEDPRSELRDADDRRHLPMVPEARE